MLNHRGLTKQRRTEHDVVPNDGWIVFRKEEKPSDRRNIILSRTHEATKGNRMRLGQLFSLGEFGWQTGNGGQLGAQPVAILHLERLEKARAEEKESHSPRSGLPSCLCMEPNAKGRVGDCAKSHSDNHDHPGATLQTRLRIIA